MSDWPAVLPSTAPAVTNAGNLGSAYTFTLPLAPGEAWLNGTLNTNLALSVTGLTVGAKLRITLMQTGSFTLSVNDGTGAVNVPIPLSSTPVVLLCHSVNGVNLVIGPVASGAPANSTFANVRDYGAKGDGIADDSTAIQAAVTAAGAGNGGAVLIPAGTYKVTTAITVPNFVDVYGRGQASIISVTGNVFAFSFAPGNRSRIRNLLIQSTAAQTAGGGIDFTSAANNCWVDDIYFGLNLFISLNVAPTTTGAGIYFLNRCRWFGVAGCGTALKIGTGTNLVTDIQCSNFSGTAANSAGMGLWVDVQNNVDTFDLIDTLFYSGSGGIQIGRNATGDVTGTKFAQVVLDNQTGIGISIAKCRDFDLDGCAIQTCGSSSVAGLNIGSFARSVRWRGGIIQNNAGDGLAIQAGATSIDIAHAHILDNNTSNTAGRHGVSIVGGVSEWSVTHCRVGNGLLGTGHQKYGLFLAAGSSDYYRAQDNRWLANETGGLVDGGTGTNKVLTGNL
jgi:hypothetical protein